MCNDEKDLIKKFAIIGVLQFGDLAKQKHLGRMASLLYEINKVYFRSSFDHPTDKERREREKKSKETLSFIQSA